MTIGADRIAIETRFLSEWDSSIPVVLENDPVQTMDKNAPWVRLVIRPGVSDPITIGSPQYIQRGRVFIQIMTPLAQGSKQSSDLTDAFIAIFRGWRSSDHRLWFDGGAGTPITEPEKDWHTTVLSIGYMSHHTA
ncbi:MAG: hypothetical protein E7773_10210 [Sphingomonas sp.]|uniref:phage tail terminator-like protein n=1 Tax=Sphingomonas sp. TaxID=28214 RepID=UPI0011FD36BF|nr:phage tail terminator-like protein [Sphingomonas sp.]THD35711.1 MAG: hypothetical protein E7773_10210 [Sphingomonas sp.]